MGELPDPDWYFENVLAYAQPGRSDPVKLGPSEQWQEWWRAQLGDEEPLRTASRQGFVLTMGQLAELNITRSGARAAVRRGTWSSPARGVLAPICTDDDAPPAWLAARRKHALAASAAALVRRNHVITGSSAAIVHGLPTLTVPDLVEVTDSRTEAMGRRSPSHVFSARLEPASITSWFGAPVSTVARTIVDQARHSRRDGLMAADAALRERLVTEADLRAELAEAAGWPGVRQARLIWEFASPLAESALESVVRLALHDFGLPPPEEQFAIGPYWVDFCWPERRLIVEADGEGKYRDEALRKEKRREHYLHVLGWRVERVMWTDVLLEWRLTRARLWQAYYAAQ